MEELRYWNSPPTARRPLRIRSPVAGEPLHVGDVTLIPVSSILRLCRQQERSARAHAMMPPRRTSGARLAKTPVAFLAVCGRELQVLTLEQPAKEKSLLAQLAPLAEGPAGRRGKKAAQAEEPLPARDGKKEVPLTHRPPAQRLKNHRL